MYPNLPVKISAEFIRGQKQGIGLTAEFKACRWFVIAPEILYSTQGAGITENNWGQDKYYIKASYINIPVMARFYVVDAFSVELGPQVGFTESVKAINKKGGYKQSQKLDFKDDYNNFEFGLGFGVTYNKNHKFFMSARYNLGLTNVLRSYKPYSN